MTQPTSHEGDEGETKPSLSTPGASGMQAGGRGGEKRERAVLPSSDTSTPPGGGDFIGAEGSSKKRCSEFLRGGGSSPPNDLETHAKGKGTLSNNMEGEAETPKEEEKKEDETKEGKGSDTFSSSGAEETLRRV